MGNLWTGYSEKKLDIVQDQVLRLVEAEHRAEGKPVQFQRLKTEVGDDKLKRIVHSIECVKCDENGKPDATVKERTPIVFVHGYMAGCLLFANNLANLAVRTERKVIALDWLGCGSSSRPKFLAKDGKETIDFFLGSFDQWREKMGIDRFDLIGHSLGGYLASHYLTQGGKDRVDHLVLASPAGFAQPPDQFGKNLPMFFRVAMYLWDRGYNPNHIIRGAGPFGKRFVTGFVDNRFGVRTLGLKGLREEEHSQLMIDYIHYISSAPASGEHALGHLLSPGAFAKEEPLVDLLPSLDDRKVLIIFGDNDWMARDFPAAEKAASRMKNTHLKTIPGTHHVYLFSDTFDRHVIDFFSSSVSASPSQVLLHPI